MKRIAVIFKSVTSLIYLFPGIAFFTAYAWPVNISKGILFALCEITGAAIILLFLIKKKSIFAKLESRITAFVIGALLLFTALFIGLAYFTSHYTSDTYNGEKVLMPFVCKEPLCKLIEIARREHEEVGVRFGKDDLITQINNCCKPELLKSEMIYYILVIAAFSVLILMFITLSIFYEQKSIHQKGSEFEDNPDDSEGLKIFLSYASEQRAVAEELCYSLQNAKHTVFFDRQNLSPGKEYNSTISKQVKSSNLMIFLISPNSVEVGAYTLAELKFAKQKWPAPDGNVLPVMAVETQFSAIPGYLRSVTVLMPEGNLIAEVLEVVNSHVKK